MNRWTKALAVVAAASMLVPLSACGGDSDAGKTKLSFFANNTQTTYQKVIDEFEKQNPDIVIDFSTTTGAQSGYQQTLQTRVSGGQLADVYMVPAEALSDLVKSGMVKDLTDEPFMEKIGESNKNAYSVDGKVYGMAISAYATVMAYNKDLLAQVGYDEIPATWDEFLDMCQKLQDAGITPYLEAKDRLGVPVESWLGYDSAQAGESLDAKIDDGSATFEEVYGPYFEEWYKIIDEGLMSSDVAGISPDQTLSEFTSGRLAVMPSGPWYIADYENAKLNYGFGMIPMLNEGDTPYAPGYPDPAFGINAKISGKELEAAEKFLTFLTSEEGLKAYQEGTGLIPNVEGYTASVDEAYQSDYDLYIATGNVYLNSAHWTKGATALRNEIYTQLQQVATGSITPTEAAANLDTKFETLS